MVQYSFSSKQDGKLSTFSSRQLFVKKIAGSIPLFEVTQKHTDTIHIVNNEQPQEVRLIVADGIILRSNKPGGLVIKTADCVPILLFDDTNTLAAIHSGRIGTELNICGKMLASLKKIKTNIATCTAIIGPALGPCCYPIDLVSIVIKQLISGGIIPSHIKKDSMCTCCNVGEVYSYRGNRKSNGTIVSALWRTF